MHSLGSWQQECQESGPAWQQHTNIAGHPGQLLSLGAVVTSSCCCCCYHNHAAAAKANFSSPVPSSPRPVAPFALPNYATKAWKVKVAWLLKSAALPISQGVAVARDPAHMPIFPGQSVLEWLQYKYHSGMLCCIYLSTGHYPLLGSGAPGNSSMARLSV